MIEEEMANLKHLHHQIREIIVIKNHLIVSMIIRNQKEKIIKVQKTFRIKKVIVKKNLINNSLAN